MRRPPRRSSRARFWLSLMAFWSVTRGDPSPCRAGENTRYVVGAELGSEYDSNVHRTELVEGAANPPIVASPAARAVVTGSLSDVVADGQSVSVSAMGAGKLFTDGAARSEDVAVAQTSGSWHLALGDRTAASVQAIYYEAFQRSTGDPVIAADRRDFRSLTPGARVTRALGERGELALGAGYRLFVLKPDLDYDFHAPTGSLDLRWSAEAGDGGADWELAAGGAAELRAFQGDALVAPALPPAMCNPPTNIGCLPSPGTHLRRDTLVMGHLELARTGKVLLGAGYALHWNSSNSFGETVTRHFVTLRLAAPLPFGIFLAARAELLVAHYQNPVFVGQLVEGAGLTYVSIEDENRSSLRVDLSRALTDRLQLLARYTIYVNELDVSGPAISYRRQTALLSLGFTIDK